MRDIVGSLIFATVLAGFGVFFWRFGVKLFSLQSRTLLGRETAYVKKTLESRPGRFSVSLLPALFFWFFAWLIVVSVAWQVWT